MIHTNDVDKSTNVTVAAAGEIKPDEKTPENKNQGFEAGFDNKAFESECTRV